MSVEILNQSTYVQKKYEERGHMGKYLIWTVKQITNNNSIKFIFDCDMGKVVTQPDLIAEVFRKHYAKLYSEPQNSTPEAINAWLEGIWLPVLAKDQQVSIVAPISLVELENVINSSPNTKPCSKDGIPAEVS